MLALLILPILVSGFVVCNNHLKYFYKLNRYEGQHLYLRCAWLGLICFFASAFTALLINSVAPSHITIVSHRICIDVIHYIATLLQVIIEGDPEKLNRVSWYLLLSVLSFFTAYLWAFISKLFLLVKTKSLSLTNAKIYLMADVLKDSPLDNALFASYLHIKPIMLSLENNKVYVGIITALGEPTENEGMDQEVSLLPLMSGYRDTETQKVHFVTDYEEIYDDNLEKSDDEHNDLSVIIKQDKIISSSWFNFNIYKTLNPTNEDTTTKAQVVAPNITTR